MEIAYQGLKFEQEFVIDGLNVPTTSNLVVTLVNRSSKKKFNATLTPANGQSHFIATWSDTMTATMPIGVYALQIYTSNTKEFIFEDNTFVRFVTSAESYPNPTA